MRRVVVYGSAGSPLERTQTIVREVASELGETVELVEVSGSVDLAFAGIVSTPAVEVDGALRVAGRVPRRAEVRGWIAEGPTDPTRPAAPRRDRASTLAEPVASR